MRSVTSADVDLLWNIPQNKFGSNGAVRLERRFTLAHELAHRIIRSTGNPAIKLEAAMNRFAGAFLVPGRHLREQAGESRHRVTSYEIIDLRKRELLEPARHTC